ncbi:Asp-tRNA(Asn)/Glu-tRNA(Gln) amidotransferase subunit GatC [Myxococcota bacterium]|nr:Asp-tRNA(Asn)/Glu-tRNA(Gln) amidotransferase subunit GatC [Myxococcota bacterium]
MAIDRAEVRRIARLAHLEYPRVQAKDGTFVEPAEHLLDDAMLDKLAAELGQILDHVRELEAVDVEGVEPTSHGVPLPTMLREDTPGHVLTTDDALASAPARVGDGVAVPKIVE